MLTSWTGPVGAKRNEISARLGISPDSIRATRLSISARASAALSQEDHSKLLSGQARRSRVSRRTFTNSPVLAVIVAFGPSGPAKVVWVVDLIFNAGDNLSPVVPP